MKLGVFLCSCGKTSNVKLNALKKIRGADVVEAHELLCQEDGLSYIADDVRRKNLDTILVGCTEKEEIFEALAEKLAVDLVTLNLCALCGWVHNRQEATEKAKILVGCGIKKLEETPTPTTIKVNVNKSVLVAGSMGALRKIAVELTKLADVTYVPDTLGKVINVKGRLGDFEVEIEANPIDWQKCVFCGKCLLNCPENAISFDKFFYINEKCTKCGKCIKICPAGAIDFQASNKILNFAQVILDSEEFPKRLGIHVIRHEDEALTTFSEVVARIGGITKAKFIDVDLNNCAAGKSGIIGCRICESSCPYNAILRQDDRVVFDDISCTGCGLCTSLCPITLPQLKEYPSKLIYSQLETLLEAKVKKKIVMFTCECGMEILSKTGAERLEYPPVLPLFVPCLSMVSETYILRALELNADGVLLMRGKCIHGIKNVPGSKFARIFQHAFELEDRVMIIEATNPQDFTQMVREFYEKLTPSKQFKMLSTVVGNKRADLVRITKSFLQNTGIKPSPLQILDFPFADILIDKEKCTLCSTCMNMCPTEAIKREDAGKIVFSYSYCIACGLCCEACPEKAITMAKILDLPRLANNERKVLVESELLKCKNCGKPFTTVSSFEKAFSILKDSGSAGEFDLESQRELMLLCENCRPLFALDIYQRKAYGDKGSS
jgi:ferredoxin